MEAMSFFSPQAGFGLQLPAAAPVAQGMRQSETRASETPATEATASSRVNLSAEAQKRLAMEQAAPVDEASSAAAQQVQQQAASRQDSSQALAQSGLTDNRQVFG